MNPLVYRQGVCDPHIHIFNDRAYLYATHDAPGYTEGFCMKDWQIWSSRDLIDWKLESVVEPEDFYCGSLDQCWAVDAAYREGTYYLYFSTGDWGVGVAVSQSPTGPFKDALGHALVDYDTYPEKIQKWDPHVFQDEDGAAYLIVGTCLAKKPWDCYLMGRLTEDMIHLAEPLRRVEYLGNPCPEDKPSIHKYNHTYYLTHASYYAVSDQVYGPYVHRGHIGFTNDHGSFFTYHNQTYFAAGGMDHENRYLRASYLVPCHYRKDGQIVIDQRIAAYGCGQYDAAWERIEARWYFEASRECKEEQTDGSFLAKLADGEYLYFPEILNVEKNTRMQIKASGSEGAGIEIYEDSLEGERIGTFVLEHGWECRLKCRAGKKSLYLKALGEVRIHWFSFDNGKKRYTAQPIFSKRGRGACLTPDPAAGNHRVLKNLQLKGAGMEVWVDGGAGGTARLIIDYCCPGGDAQVGLHVDGKEQGIIAFPETPTESFKEFRQKCLAVKLPAGLGRIGLWTKEYQKGRLRIGHLTVETKRSNCQVYAAAEGMLFPAGNGCWDGLPQWETDPEAFSGRIVKYLENPGDAVTLSGVDGGSGGDFCLMIHYGCREMEGSLYELLVNGRVWKRITFPHTGGSGMERMQNLPVKVTLKPGKENTLGVRKTGSADGGICVDAFGVVPAGAWE